MNGAMYTLEASDGQEDLHIQYLHYMFDVPASWDERFRWPEEDRHMLDLSLAAQNILFSLHSEYGEEKSTSFYLNGMMYSQEWKAPAFDLHRLKYPT